MNVLPEESPAPSVEARTVQGEAVTSAAALARGPLVLVFGSPEIHASRLVVGYLRRLKERLPELAVWLVLQGEPRAVRAYHEGYLEGLTVIHDGALELSYAFAVTHLPAVYYLTGVPGPGRETADAQARDPAKDAVAPGDASAGCVRMAFTGFSRAAMNALADLAARASGAKPQDLITASDNKGDYELAERALSG